MDLDIFDFDAPPDSFYFPHTQNRLSDFGSMDQPAPYGDMPPQVKYSFILCIIVSELVKNLHRFLPVLKSNIAF